MNSLLRLGFFSKRWRQANFDPEQTRDHYFDLVKETMEQCDIACDSLIVEIHSVGLTVERKSVYAAKIYLTHWEQNSALRLLVGLPLIEAKVREAARSSWLAGHSHFIGLWIHASGRMKYPCDLRRLVRELTADSSAPPPSSDLQIELAIQARGAQNGLELSARRSIVGDLWSWSWSKKNQQPQ